MPPQQQRHCREETCESGSPSHRGGRGEQKGGDGVSLLSLLPCKDEMTGECWQSVWDS